MVVIMEESSRGQSHVTPSMFSDAGLALGLTSPKLFSLGGLHAYTGLVMQA